MTAHGRPARRINSCGLSQGAEFTLVGLAFARPTLRVAGLRRRRRGNDLPTGRLAFLLLPP